MPSPDCDAHLDANFPPRRLQCEDDGGVVPVGLGEGYSDGGGGGGCGRVFEDVVHEAAPLAYDIFVIQMLMSSSTTPCGTGRRRSRGGTGLFVKSCVRGKGRGGGG